MEEPQVLNGIHSTTAEVYVSGALTSLDDGAPVRLFYELLGEIVSGCGMRPYLPHRVTDPIAAAHLDARAVYDIDRAHVASASLLIGYAGIPSFGVGIEVELAREHGVPVIIVAERERRISRILLGNPAVAEVVRFTDLEGLRRTLTEAIARVRALPPVAGRSGASDEVVVQRFLASLEEARHLPDAEVAALLRVAGLDGDLARAVHAAIARGELFGAGLRDLVGRHALRGSELGLFVLRDVLERPMSETARRCGMDPRTARRSLGAIRLRLGLAEDADPLSVGQWLVTELIAPPTRALQLHLFEHSNGMGDAEGA